MQNPNPTGGEWQPQQKTAPNVSNLVEIFDEMDIHVRLNCVSPTGVDVQQAGRWLDGPVQHEVVAVGRGWRPLRGSLLEDLDDMIRSRYTLTGSGNVPLDYGTRLLADLSRGVASDSARSLPKGFEDDFATGLPFWFWVADREPRKPLLRDFVGDTRDELTSGRDPSRAMCRGTASSEALDCLKELERVYRSQLRECAMCSWIPTADPPVWLQNRWDEAWQQSVDNYGHDATVGRMHRVQGYHGMAEWTVWSFCVNAA